MKKFKRKVMGIVLMILLMFSVCACGQTSGPANSSELELDYIGEEVTQIEEDASWKEWVSDAFDFGKVETTSNSKASDQSQPDSVEEFYVQGTESAQSKTGTTNKTNKSETKKSDYVDSYYENNTAEKDETVNDVKNENNDVGSEDNVTAPEKPDSSKDTVTITIRCDTAVNNGMHLESKWAGIVPASGCILPETTVEIEEGDTVFNVLSKVCDKYKIHMEYRGGTSSGCYIEGINNLYEFDGGRWSGWMYSVDDWYPNYGCGVYFVKAGQVIEWNYTCDLGLDLDSGWWEGAEDWKENHE